MNLALHVEPEANFDSQRRLIAYAPIFFASLDGTAVFAPGSDERREACCATGHSIAGWADEKERSD
jgi:hypothetical protein